MFITEVEDSCRFRTASMTYKKNSLSQQLAIEKTTEDHKEVVVKVLWWGWGGGDDTDE